MTITTSGASITFTDSTVQQSAARILQAIQTVLPSTFTSTTKTTWTDITGLSVSITPKYSTSKVMVVVALNGRSGVNDYPRGYSVTRNGTRLTVGNSGTGVPSSMVSPELPGSRDQVTISYTFLDSPASTSALTYQAQFYIPSGAGGTVYVNTSPGQDSNSFLPISTITVYEVAA